VRPSYDACPSCTGKPGHRVERLYSPGELLELWRKMLATLFFSPGYERNQHLQVAVSLRALFKK
jgi:hypothetical protein